MILLISSLSDHIKVPLIAIVYGYVRHLCNPLLPLLLCAAQCPIPTTRELNVYNIVHRIQSTRATSLQKQWAQCTRRHFALIVKANCMQKLLLDHLLTCIHDVCRAGEGETIQNSRFDESKLGNLWQHREEEVSQIVSVIQLLRLLVKTVAVSVNSSLFPWS